MFNQKPPTGKEVRAQYAIEFGPKSPRLKLTVIDTLVANGVAAEELVPRAKEVLEFLTDGVEEFLDTILQVIPEPTEVGEEHPDVTTEDDGFGPVTNGYNYL